LTCAGAGGKTLHMAALMENKGLLIAMDLYESKLKQLKMKQRDGAFNIEYRIIDSTKVIKSYIRKQIVY
jgi:16S rRNA (cytosine967-C5)-methyltransferase